MAWLAINGLNVGAIAAVGEKPKGERRNIGDVSEAGDGSLRMTRQTQKIDVKFTSIALISSLAYAWTSLLTGEGERWSFDTSEYGSKGTPPSSSVYSLIAGGAKFGAGLLRLPATTGTFSLLGVLANSFGSSLEHTMMVWRLETAVWHHYIVRSDGAKWLDGVRNDGVSTTWFTPAAPNMVIANTSGSAQDYDDLVVLPFKIPDAWAPVLGVATTAFSALPFLNATGDLVNEQATRRVLGTVNETVLRAVSGGATQKDMKQLEVELKAA